jgi:hypothetical protein
VLNLPQQVLIIKNYTTVNIAWLGQVMRMDDKRTPKRISEWQPIGMRIRGRPMKRWIVDIKEDMQIMGILIRWWRKQRKERAEGKIITEKAKSQVGCNTSKKRRRYDCKWYPMT